MRKENRFMKAFGINEIGTADFPKKISNVKISRIKIGPESGCTWCFPHGVELKNSHFKNQQRNWKKYRITQWR